MFTGSEVIIIDVMWCEEENGGKFSDIVSGFNDPSKYYWRCFGCNSSYKATVREFMWKMERLKFPMLNGYCPTCTSKGIGQRFMFESAFSFMSEGFSYYVEGAVREFKAKGSKTTVFITKCQDCGEYCYSTLNTFEARGKFICLSCYSRANRIKKNGSLAGRLPEIIEWYSPDNKFSPDKVPMDKLTAPGNSYILICPRCGKRHSKRLDAIVRGGAYCEQCNHVFSSIRKNGSLYDKFPKVAAMWDNGGNPISSDQVSPFSEEEGVFLCDGEKSGLPPHRFTKSVYFLTTAAKEGKLGCPVCSGFEVQSGVNDFETQLPELSKYWDYDLNNVSPNQVYYNSETKYAFICKHGHRFMRDPSHMRRSVGTSTEGCPVCHGKVIITGINDLFSLRPDVMNSWVYEKNTELNPKKLAVYSNKTAWFKCVNNSCGREFLSPIDQRCMTIGLCPDCRSKQYSEPEKEIVQLIRSWGFDVLEECRLTGNRQSFDMYIPSKNLAIEYNGLYWHSDVIREDHNYHFNKTMDCRKIGIDLIHIWADDFELKRDIVIDMLKNKLGVSDKEKVHARECKVCDSSIDIARDFMATFHIQGFASGSRYISLTYQDKVVAMGIFQLRRDSLYLSRYSTSCIVRGGLSKILSYISKEYPDIKQIETFSDNCISNGNLYKKTGFTAVNMLPPDYSYVVNDRRIHKFNFRKDRFKSDPNLEYRDGLSESELASLNLIGRVWDAGKIKWVKFINS